MNRHVKIHDYLNKMAELEVQARNCYLDEIKMDSSDFLQMLLLDGCLILVHLHGVDGTEMSRNEVDEGHNPDKIDKGSIIEHGTECNTGTEYSFEEIKEKNAVAASANIRQLKHTEPIVEQSQVSQEKVRDKFYRGHYQDGKWYYSRACHDFLMLENQIPFFVVKTIYKLFANTQDVNRLTDNIAKFIEGTLYFYPKAIMDADRPKNFHHLLHLCHMYISPSQQRQHGRKFSRADYQTVPLYELSENHLNSYHRGKLYRWRHAVQYHEAGIEFKRRELNEHSPHSLLDVRFHNGVLEIPFLLIDQMTVPLFRNFIALEQSSPHLGNDFTAYAAFISQLISGSEDVSFLLKRGIIVHQMRSDEEVSALFTKLGKNVDFDLNGKYYLRSTGISMEEHYQSRLNRWMAWLWQNHFRNPWMSLAVLAAIVVLVCTFLQLLFALLAYLNPVADSSSRGSTSPPTSHVH
jgi:hypothetical protein